MNDVSSPETQTGNYLNTVLTQWHPILTITKYIYHITVQSFGLILVFRYIYRVLQNFKNLET